jgi:hypothetical protein
VMVLPRDLDMIEAGRHMPLPVAKPKIFELEVHKHDRGKVNLANSDHKNERTATTRQTASARVQPERALRRVIVMDHKNDFQGTLRRRLAYPAQ